MSYNYVDYEIRNVTKVRNLGVFGYKCEWDYVVNEALWIITLEETKSYEIRLRNTKIRKYEIRKYESAKYENTKVRNTKYESTKYEIRNTKPACRQSGTKMRNTKPANGS